MQSISTTRTVLLSQLIVILIIGFSEFGCEKKSKTPPPGIKRVNGDPIVFVKGTATNGETGGLPENIFDENKKWTYSLSGYIQQELNNYDDEITEQAPPEQETDDRILIKERIVKFLSSDMVILKDNSSEKDLEIKLSKKDGLWKVSSLLSSGFDFSLLKYDYQIKHYSFKPDFSAFSILIYITSEENKVKYLLNFSFGSIDVINTAKVEDVPYNYYYGRGVKVKWNQKQEVPVTLCGIEYKGMAKALRDGIELWRPYLKNRLSFEVKESSQCPPFSDVNIHGIYNIDEWIEIEGEPGVMAQTPSVMNASTGLFVDSDIIFLKGELKEAMHVSGQDSNALDTKAFYDMTNVQTLYSDTNAHEFGHFLGLHHIFDGTPSIMSYDSKDDGIIHKYDKDAIQELYPLIK